MHCSAIERGGLLAPRPRQQCTERNTQVAPACPTDFAFSMQTYKAPLTTKHATQSEAGLRCHRCARRVVRVEPGATLHPDLQQVVRDGKGRGHKEAQPPALLAALAAQVWRLGGLGEPNRCRDVCTAQKRARHRTELSWPHAECEQGGHQRCSSAAGLGGIPSGMPSTFLRPGSHVRPASRLQEPPPAPLGSKRLCPRHLCLPHLHG